MQDEIASEIRQCPYCGTLNDATEDNCKKCGRALMTFDGQAVPPETFERKLAAQVETVNNRPPVVPAMAAFSIVFALFWPLRAVVTSFASRPTVNAEGTNAIGSALGSVGPIFTTLLCLPAAALLAYVAWATITQRTWAWMANFIMLGVFAVLNIAHLASVPVLSMLIIAGALAAFWLKPETKAWFGLM